MSEQEHGRADASPTPGMNSLSVVLWGKKQWQFNQIWQEVGQKKNPLNFQEDYLKYR